MCTKIITKCKYCTYVIMDSFGQNGPMSLLFILNLLAPLIYTLRLQKLNR